MPSCGVYSITARGNGVENSYKIQCGPISHPNHFTKLYHLSHQYHVGR
jgi:hypothetical protein